MRCSIRLGRLLAAGIVVAAAVGSLAHASHAEPPAPAVPSAIAVPAGNKVFLVGHAVGVQIYACNATSSGFGWRFVAPRAALYDDRGKLIITHFGGPSWQATDGSTVMGRREAGVTVDATAIDWLLLSVASTVEGPDGDRLVARRCEAAGCRDPLDVRGVSRNATPRRQGRRRRSRIRPTTTSGRHEAPDGEHGDSPPAGQVVCTRATQM